MQKYSVSQDNRVRRVISKSVLKRLLAEFGGLCAISDCPPNQLDDGTPMVEVAHICSVVQGAPRYDASLPISELNEYDNLLFLCAFHHRLVDSQPEAYPAERLREIRRRHLQRVSAILSSTTGGPSRQAKQGDGFREAVSIWRSERLNSSEEYWQNLFFRHPELLAPALTGQPYVLHSKCYVGGKSLSNTGGNIVDFLAQHGGNVTLVELKIPSSPLVGRPYGKNFHCPSRELTGACVQVLGYRTSLIRDLNSIQANGTNFAAHSPQAVVVIGDLEVKELTASQRHSFEIYRNSMRDLQVITYDELFSRIEQLADLISAFGSD